MEEDKYYTIKCTIQEIGYFQGFVEGPSYIRLTLNNVKLSEEKNLLLLTNGPIKLFLDRPTFFEATGYVWNGSEEDIETLKYGLEGKVLDLDPEILKNKEFILCFIREKSLK